MDTTVVDSYKRQSDIWTQQWAQTTKPKTARVAVRLHEALLSRRVGAVASPVITGAGRRQVHVYRQPVEEVNHSGCARSAFEGKSSGIELACMQSRTGQRWRSWDYHMVGFAKKAGDEASTVNSSLGGTGRPENAQQARKILVSAREDLHAKKKARTSLLLCAPVRGGC